jgi:hypothetical protein
MRAVREWRDRLQLLRAVDEHGHAYDVLTVRGVGESRPQRVTLSAAVAMLEQGRRRYREIHCLFCRSLLPHARE